MNLNGLMGFPDLGLSRSPKSLNLFEYSDSILCRGCLNNTYIIVEVWTWKKVTFAHLVTSNDLYCSHRILLNIGIIWSLIKVKKFLEILHPYKISNQPPWVLLERPHHPVDGVHPVDVILGPHLVQALVPHTDMEHRLKPLLSSQYCNSGESEYITYNTLMHHLLGQKSFPSYLFQLLPLCNKPLSFYGWKIGYFQRSQAQALAQATFLALCKLYPSVCWIFLSDLVAFSCSNHWN